MFVLGSYRAGESPTQSLSFSLFRGELETYRARLTYPAGFRFNGFEALGPAPRDVGVIAFDLDADGAADLVVPLRSLGARLAYADVIPDGQFSPQLEPTLGHGADTLVLRLPFGGDANPATVVATFDARVTLTLAAGLLTNPDQPGDHVLTAELISVDPDTDGPDDGAGTPPQALAFEVSVPIQGRPLVPFDALCVHQVNARSAGPSPHGGRHHRHVGPGKKRQAPDDRFSIHGRFRLGAGSDGIALSEESVTVVFGPFQQEIPGAAFSARGGAVFRLEHPGPGITLLRLGPHGFFHVEARGVDLGGLDHRQPVPFVLLIGDDRGEVPLALDRHGHLERPHGRCTP
jgi:hypothetical protein